MLTYFKIPYFIKSHLEETKSQKKILSPDFQKISDRCRQIHSMAPTVSIVVIAYNEEKDILNCISSLSFQETNIPYEIIVVNNNSDDATQSIIDRCGVISVFQKEPGPGHARQAGLNVAKGKYHLCADADSVYPPTYVNEMVKSLKKNGVVGAFGSVSFLPGPAHKRFTLAFYEIFRNIIVKFRSVNRPELAIGGANFGFLTEIGQKYGWRTDIKRGEDGCMLLDLKKNGKVIFKQSRKSTVWTSARTLRLDGNFIQMVLLRVTREFKRLNEYFYKEKGEYQIRNKNIS